MLTELKNFRYSLNELNINVGMVEEAMGYFDSSSPEPFPEMIALALEQSEALCDIKGSLLFSSDFSCDKEGHFNFEGITFNAGTKIIKQLDTAEGAILFICTAGSGIGERSKNLMSNGDFMEGYILDVIGSVMVEAAIDKIQDSVENEMIGIGLKLTNRYSPGYCGWSLAEQKQLFDLFPNNFCGIRLSDSFLMDPVKSVSGIMGFGPNIKNGIYECQLCELVTCFYRKIRIDKHKKIK
ncbi:MAG: vitamin B12 dependent-methionine synthase activation domain-containing protein [Mariniphaga sp.]